MLLYWPYFIINFYVQLTYKLVLINWLTTIVHFQKQDLQSELEGNKKTYEGMKMEAEEQVILLRQQIVALRKALADAQKEANDVRKLLDKEVIKLFRPLEFSIIVTCNKSK